MNKTERIYPDIESLKSAVYGYAATAPNCYILDSNGTEAAHKESRYEILAGFGQSSQYKGDAAELLNLLEGGPAWKFVHVTYGHFQQAQIHITVPEILMYALKDSSTLHILDNANDSASYGLHLSRLKTAVYEDTETPEKPEFIAEVSESTYKQTVEKIREDIAAGKYYELNYCIGFKASFEGQGLLSAFRRLNSLSRAPFSAYVKQEEFTLLCSSPERFLRKQGRRLLSQPIKGTNRRLEGSDNHLQMMSLAGDEKERAENVMIVDLVRNDLSKVCQSGSVKVEELCAPYAYRSVNHLVSSISGELREGVGLAAVFEALFPMGSMTGAPKLEVMKHIDLYELSGRGIYSGCLGYVDPAGDFDFNVVIRSLVYSKGELTFKVGSAITFDSLPENEYSECLLKGSRLQDVFSGR